MFKTQANFFYVSARITASFIVGLLMICCSQTLSAQESIEFNLQQSIKNSAPDSVKIRLMGELARHYYANKSYEKGDSIFEKQIMLAESLLKPRLVLESYFNNTYFLVSSAETKERTQSIRNYIKRALDFARANDLTEYIALGFSHLSAVNLSDGQPDEAFRNANLAFTTSLNTSNDSIQVISAIQLGKAHQEKSDIVMAYKVFTNAQNIAVHSENENLLPPVYHAFAEFYKKFGKENEAKKYIIQSLQIHSKLNDKIGIVQDNIFLAKLSNILIVGKEHLNTAISLADSLNSLPLKLEAERILFYHLINEGKPSAALDFISAHQELKNVFINTGPFFLDWMIAEIYLYGGMPDSALKYFKNGENAFNSGYDLSAKKSFFAELAYCYSLLGKTKEAIFYNQKTFDIAKASSDLRWLQTSSKELKKLYEKSGDYRQAYEYNLLYDKYKDSVDQLGRERDLAGLEIENVAKAEQRLLQIEKDKLQRRYNLQYMLITIIVATAFLLLIMIGMFKVSTFMIRIMGFLSLIFFFEFIILILDNWIHHLTHGEPWKVWLIKIGIISFLLPVHHFLEHKLIHYLLSRHLITVRNKLSMKNLFKRKKIALQIDEELKVDTPGKIADQSQDKGGGQTVPRLK